MTEATGSSPILLHIPHSATAIPEVFLEDYVISPAELEVENRIMGDLHTDRLFPAEEYPSIIFPWSRLFVDVERFREDADEHMATRGMGALYERGHRLQRIRMEMKPAERERILRHYYDPHHAKLEQAVDELLADSGSVLIIDCHSFPADRLPYENPDDRIRPEICIGTDPFHTPVGLRDKAVAAFQGLGYSVDIDYPFGGSITPLKHYAQTKAVRSLMIEIRRDLFVEKGGASKRTTFPLIKNHIAEVIASLNCFS